MAIERTEAEQKAFLEEQIRVMLRNAESRTPEEAEVVMKRVEKLMLKLGIDDVLQLSRDRKTEVIDSIEFAFEGVYANAFVHMTYAIILALGDMRAIASDHFNATFTKKIGLKLIVMGHEGDLNRAKILVDSLVLQSITATTKHMNDYNKSGFYATPSEKFNEKRSFIVGFGRGASERIKRTRVEVVAEATVSTPGTALVLAQRGELVTQAFNERFTQTKNTRGMKISGNGYLSGKAAGRKARTGIEAEVGNSTRGELR